MTIRCSKCNSRFHLDDGHPIHSAKPAIVVAGLSCETSTFTPARTDLGAFHPVHGDEVFNAYPFLRKGTTLGDQAEWRCTVTARALPGGIVARDAFEQLTSEIITGLHRIQADGPIDGLWFDIHGAMTVEGLDDSEAELLRRIRKVIGLDALVSISMDLHGDVSRDLVARSDLITCYRMAPHEDVLETQVRACRNLVDLLLRRQQHGEKFQLPVKAWIPIPILLPGEKTSTRVEPAKSIYAAVREVESSEHVIDAAVWVGYAWSDEPRSHATAIVTGTCKVAVKEGCERLGRMFWAARAEFKFVAPTGSFDECLEAARESDARPCFISDSGDNPTAGGSGDVTWTLDRLLSLQQNCRSQNPLSEPKIFYASLPGAEAVDLAEPAGVGAVVTVTAGAEVDDIHAGPITLTGRVHAIKQGDKDVHTEVVLNVESANVFVILTRKRKPYHYIHDFTDLNLDISDSADVIVIVKIGYLEPELYAAAADWKMALTPGGVDQDIVRLGHQRIRRPMWPFDQKFDEDPDLSARIIERTTTR